LNQRAASTWSFGKSLHFRYLGHNDSVFPVNNAADAFCVQDAYLLGLNLPAGFNAIATQIS
jgi:hypothetical protein